MEEQLSHPAPTVPGRRVRISPLLLVWVTVSALIVAAAYAQTAGLWRLAAFTQLVTGYDIFSQKRFDIPRLPPTKNFDVVAQKGGKLSAIAVKDKYAYIGAGQTLLVVNIENPKQIETVGSLLLLGQISDIKVENNFAYVCNGRGGLRIIDVSKPEAPKEVAAYGHMAAPKHVAIGLECAYIAAGMNGLEIIDVKHPTSPSTINFQDAAEKKSETLDALSVCIDKERLCVMDEDQGLRLFDLKDPRNPIKLGDWKAGGRGLRRGAAGVEDNTLVIAGDSPDAGVSILNIEGSKPELASSIDVPSYWYGTSTLVRNGFAYIGTSSGLLIVDIHNRKKPKQLSSTTLVTGIKDLDVEGTKLYATTSAGDLTIVDISDPFTPLLVSHHHIGGDAQMLALMDGTLYATSNPSEVQSFKPQPEDKTPPSVQTFNFKGVRALCQSDADIVVADERFPAKGARISLATLLQKQPDGTFKEKWSQTVEKSNRELACSKNNIFVAAEDGVHIFTKSGNQRFFHPIKTGADILGAHDDFLYVVTDTGPKETLLYVFNAKDPEHLKKVGQISIDKNAYALVTDARHVYVLEGGIWGDRELSILDRTTSGALKRTGTIKIKQADRLAVEGNRAYVQGFLQVNSVDISNPKNPKLVGTVDLSAIPLSASDIEAKNGIVYIAAEDGGVYILKDKTL